MIWDDLRAMPPATSEETALIERALRVCYDWNENGEILRLGVLRAIREARAATRKAAVGTVGPMPKPTGAEASPGREDERAEAVRRAFESALADDPTMLSRAWQAVTFAADVTRETYPSSPARRRLVEDELRRAPADRTPLFWPADSEAHSKLLALGMSEAEAAHVTPAEGAEIASAPGQIGPGQTPIGRPLPADASLEARAEALGRAIIDKLGPLAPTPPRYFRDTCIDLVRAVDASRPPTIFAPWTREEARIRLLGLGHSASEVEAWLDQPAAMLERLTPDCVEAAVLRGVLRGNASRPGLSEEQLRAIVKATIEAKCAQGMADMRVCIAEHELTCAIVAALLRASRGETGIVREPHVDVHCARCDKPVGETAVREGEDVLCLPCSIDDLDGRDLDRSS